MSQAVKRACDACHRRKVKCDGINPCRNCSSAQLSCTYNAIPQKKGPKGSRAKVISELRETQRQTSLTAKVHNRINGIPGPSEPAGGAPTPGLLSPELVKECLDYYFANAYEKAPILDRRSIEPQLKFMEQHRDAYCLLTSLCAFIMLQPGMTLPAGDSYGFEMVPGVNLVASQLLVDECLRVRKGYDCLENPSLNTLTTSFFVVATLQTLEQNDRAWFHLREATTIIQLKSMNVEETYAQWDSTESSRRRRLYWLLYIQERTYALQKQRPLTLQATINLPSTSDDPTDPHAHQLSSFVMLVKLFNSFDDIFTGVWGKTKGKLSTGHTASLQKQLNELLPSYMCQDAQLADLHTNQQWLKTTHWQLTNGTINSHNDDGINWQCPRDLSKELLMKMASQFPGQAMELLGSGLIEKLFEISHNMMDFLAMQPPSRDPFSTGPREYLNQILNIVAVLRLGNHFLLPLMFSKVNDMLPRLTNPMVQDMPDNYNLSSMDIFDGFGNAGMAQPTAQYQMHMDAEFDRKFSMSEYDKSFSEMSGSDGTNGASGSSADMNSPFVGSPGVMSPGMEFPRQNIDGFCTPMAESVMNQLGSTASLNGGAGQSHQHQQPPPQHQQHQHHQPHHILQSQFITTQQLSPPSSIGPHHSHHNASPPSNQPQGLTDFNSPPSSQPGMNTASMPTAHAMSQGMSNGGGGGGGGAGGGAGGTGGIMGQIPRQTPQRTNSFAIPPQPQIPRTVGDFHALQRSNTSDMGAMSSMSPAEMDFGGMR